MNAPDPSLEAVARFVANRTGLTFANRRDSAELGIRRAMTRARTADVTAYLDLLAADARAFDDLLAELTVGETYFFREPGQFAFLRREVLPALRQRGPAQLVRAWSAGCASGEEAYSLAILFEEEGLAAQSSLLATDICRAALARAWRATYGAWSLRGPSATAALPYLRPAGKLWQVEERIRRRVTLQHLNLALDVYPSFATGTWGLDIILCRNVLIYFDKETVSAVARRLFAALVEGGWLLTAASDPPLGDTAPFETLVTDDGVFYRRPAPAGSREGEAPAEPSGGLLWHGLPTMPPTATEGLLRSGRPAVEPVARSGDRATTEAEPRPPMPDSASRLSPDRAAEARQAFDRGEYVRAAALAAALTDDPTSAALQVRALANLDTADAERAAEAAARRHALSAELRYLHAVLLLELGRVDEAVGAVRRVLYIDRSLALAHFTLGAILRRAGDTEGARRAYRNARDLCAACPPDQILPLSDGERAGRLVEAAETQLALLDTLGGFA